MTQMCCMSVEVSQELSHCNQQTPKAANLPGKPAALHSSLDDTELCRVEKMTASPSEVELLDEISGVRFGPMLTDDGITQSMSQALVEASFSKSIERLHAVSVQEEARQTFFRKKLKRRFQQLRWRIHDQRFPYKAARLALGSRGWNSV